MRIVGSSEPGGLRKQQKAMLQPGEVAATGLGHAEVTVTNFAKSNGLDISEIAASRPVCENCYLFLKQNNVKPVTPLSKKAQQLKQ